MSDPVRVLQVFAEMNRGGAETMIMNLYRHMDREKIQFDFIVHTQEKCAFDEEIERLGGRIYRVPKYKGTNHFIYKNTWKKFFEKHTNYKIIHGHIRSTASIYLKIAKNFNLITIAHSHNTSSGNGIESKIKDIIQYPIRNIAHFFLACSEDAGRWLFGDRIVTTDNFQVLKNAIDTEQYLINIDARNIIRKEFNIEDKYVIGHIGRFHKQKNHEFIIEIFKNIYELDKETILLLIGDGSLKDAIQLKVKNEKLEKNVIFTGVRSDIPVILQGMDIFIMPSVFEGLPVTLIEAQASGLKIIASDKITREVKITKLIDFVSIQRSAKDWAEIILKESIGNTRVDESSQIIKNGYDVRANAEWLEKYYLSII